MRHRLFVLIFLSVLAVYCLGHADEQTTPEKDRPAWKDWVVFGGEGVGIGFFDPVTDRFVIPLIFKRAFTFADNGLAVVMLKNDKWGFINPTGKVVIPAQFEEAYDFDEYGLARVRINDKWGLIDAQGKFVLPPKYYWFIGGFHHGLAQVEYKGKYGSGYCDPKGILVIPPQFERAEKFSIYGLARVQRDGLWGYINTLGKVVIALQFESARDFSANGLAPVKKDELYGYIDATGALVIAPQFLDAREFFDNGLAPVQTEDGWGYINTQGDLVIAPQYESVGQEFSDNGLTGVQLDGLWGYINAQGQMIISPHIGYGCPFGPNGFAVASGENGDEGFIDISGKFVIPPQFPPGTLGSFESNGLVAVDDHRGYPIACMDMQGVKILYWELIEDKDWVMKNRHGQIIWPETGR